MKKTKSFSLLLLGLLSLSFLSGCGSSGEDIVIFYTTDVHCAVDDNIGYAALRSYVKREKESSKNVTLVDAGDATQGSLIGSLSKGEYIFDIMNALDYELFTLGNHDFDYGLDNLKERIDQFKGEVLSCNVSYSGQGENKLSGVKPYSILSYGDVKVGYVGVTTPSTLVASNPANFKENGKTVYSFGEDDLAGIVQSNVDACRAKGCKYVILLSHLGYSDNYSPYSSPEIIASLSGVTAVLDGHSHQKVECNYYKDAKGNSVPLCTAGYHMDSVGKVILKPDGKVEMGLITASIDGDLETIKLIDGLKAKLDEDLKKVVAHSDLSLSIADANGIRMARSREVGLGDLVADAFREVSGSDIGFINGGGLRDDIHEGDLTYGDIKKVLPFDNQLVTVWASGQNILDYLEFASRKTKKEYTVDGKADGENGAFVQASGLRYAIDTAVESTVRTDETGNFVSVDGARRVKNVTVLENGEYAPIDPAAKYKVTSISFILRDGGDGANMFQRCEVINPNVRLDSEALTYYLVDVLHGKLKDKYQAVGERISIL